MLISVPPNFALRYIGLLVRCIDHALRVKRQMARASRVRFPASRPAAARRNLHFLHTKEPGSQGWKATSALHTEESRRLLPNTELVNTHASLSLISHQRRASRTRDLHRELMVWYQYHRLAVHELVDTAGLSSDFLNVTRSTKHAEHCNKKRTTHIDH